MLNTEQAAAVEFSDQEYIDAGAIMAEKSEVYTKCDLLYKVKEIEYL